MGKYRNYLIDNFTFLFNRLKRYGDKPIFIKIPTAEDEITCY
jgi:hypothetical protein